MCECVRETVELHVSSYLHGRIGSLALAPPTLNWQVQCAGTLATSRTPSSASTAEQPGPVVVAMGKALTRGVACHKQQPGYKKGPWFL